MLRRLLYAAALLAALVYTLFPFYWALNGSLQPAARLFAIPADYLPLPPSLSSYRDVLQNDVFLKSLRNSAIVSASVALLALACGSLAAYALARFRMRGGRIALGLILAMTMFPQISILGAVHSIITWLGLYNTLGGLVLTYMLFTLPLTVWVLTGFFRTLPRELEESAYVDGAGPLQTFWHVMLPLATPGLAATGLLTFIAAWNEYLFALSLTITDDARTVPVVIANLSGATIHETPWGAIMAGCVIVTVPLVVLVMIFQKRIVQGLTAGAVKG
jgi:trehalose/maltose transport system permease protein